MQENKLCADCKNRPPSWASINLGVFVCIECSGCHRELGTHISKIKSINLDSWNDEILENFKKINNKISNDYWEYNLHNFNFNSIKNDRNKLMEFIKNKYENRKWINPNEINPMNKIILENEVNKIKPNYNYSITNFNNKKQQNKESNSEQFNQNNFNFNNNNFKNFNFQDKFENSITNNFQENIKTNNIENFKFQTNSEYNNNMDNFKFQPNDVNNNIGNFSFDNIKNFNNLNNASFEPNKNNNLNYFKYQANDDNIKFNHLQNNINNFCFQSKENNTINNFEFQTNDKKNNNSNYYENINNNN